jgi:hypothetical protein
VGHHGEPWKTGEVPGWKMFQFSEGENGFSELHISLDKIPRSFLKKANEHLGKIRK